MYEEDMDQSCTDMPLSADGITQAHEDALMRAMQFLRKRAVGRKAKEYILKLEKEMMNILNEYKELNYLESKELYTFGRNIIQSKIASIDQPRGYFIQTKWIYEHI